LFGERGVAFDYFLETQHLRMQSEPREGAYGSPILPCGVYRGRFAGGSAQIGGSRGIR
jgi:hypothetical protein